MTFKKIECCELRTCGVASKFVYCHLDCGLPQYCIIYAIMLSSATHHYPAVTNNNNDHNVSGPKRRAFDRNKHCWE